MISVVSEKILTKILQLRREAGKIIYKDLFNEEEITNFPAESQVFVSKLLEPSLYKLLSSTIKLAKPLGYKFIWSNNNCIKIRKDEESQIYDIYNLADLKFLK